MLFSRATSKETVSLKWFTIKCSNHRHLFSDATMIRVRSYCVLVVHVPSFRKNLKIQASDAVVLVERPYAQRLFPKIFEKCLDGGQGRDTTATHRMRFRPEIHLSFRGMASHRIIPSLAKIGRCQKTFYVPIFTPQ